VTLDGIPETLSPVAETAERTQFIATDARLRTRRRSSHNAPEEESAHEDEDAEDQHVLNDLA